MRLARLLENCAIYGHVINCVYISGNVSLVSSNHVTTTSVPPEKTQEMFREMQVHRHTYTIHLMGMEQSHNLDRLGWMLPNY